MEHKENQNFENNNTSTQEPVFLKEKSSHHKGLWYWIIVILLLGLLGWYGYTAGWFAKNTTNIIPIESNKGMVDGVPLNNLKGEQAPIDNITIKTSNGFPVEKTLVLKGSLADGCSYLNDPQVIRKGNVFYVNLTTFKEGDTCTEALVPYERNIGLDVAGLPAGTYNVVINGKQTSFELAQDNALNFEAGAGK